MEHPDAEERHIDNLLREMNIRLPVVPQEESEMSDTPAFKEWEFQERIYNPELIEGLGNRPARE